MATVDTYDSQQRMADALLRSQETTLADFLSTQVGLGRSLEHIAQELYATTDRAVQVSYGTIRRWLLDLDLLSRREAEK